jgi:AcrR family transcriptional regulator
MPLLAPVTITVRPVISGTSETLKVVIDNNVDGDNYDVNSNIVRYALPAMTRRPYHHGNLRAALLEQAERMVREQGVEQLSLRELARQVGVSHGAPRRHFADRQALLDALAESGFERLGAELRSAMVDAGEDFQARLQATATAYVRFATRDAALLELMFAGKHRDQSGSQLYEAAERAFAVMLELIEQGQAEEVLDPGDPERVGLVLFATIQGIAALLNSGIVAPDELEPLVADSIAHFLRGSRAGYARIRST